FLFSITPDHSVIKSGVVEPQNVARVELNCPLQISGGLFPAPLTPLDPAHQPEHPGIIRQAPACNFQFSQSAIVIEVSLIKMARSCKVCFARIWTDAKGFADGRF